MRKLFYFMLIAVFMTAFTSQGFAQEETTTSKKMVKVHHGELAECCSLKDLQLTDKQKAKIDQMKKVFAEDQKKLREKLAKLQGELHKLMEAEKPKKESINKKLEEIGNLEIVCKKMLVNHKLEFHALLTPEQLKKAKEIHGKACCAKSHGQKAHHWHAKQGFDCCAKDHNCSAKTHECCKKAEKCCAKAHHAAKATCSQKSTKAACEEKCCQAKTEMDPHSHKEI